MATILDVGILNYIAPLMVFLFVWLIMFAVLTKVKFLSDNKNINSFFSFIVAVLFMFVSPLVTVVKVMTPWFVVLFILIIMMMLLFMVLGVGAEELTKTVWNNSALVWILFFVGLGIFGYALSNIYGEDIQSVYGGDGTSGAGGLMVDIVKIIFHPKILGMALILVIASQAMRLISS